MAWIKTIPFTEASEALQKILLEAQAACPPEYMTPVPAASPDDESIVATHTLIPEALRHAFGTHTALLSPELPLTRRQHEMIATMVSATNRCHY